MKKFLAITLFVALMLCSLATAESLEGFRAAWQGLAPTPFQESVKVGVERWAEEHPEAEVVTNIGVDNTTSTQQSDLESFAAQGIKYISVYPADNSFINGIADDFASMGITTVTFSAQPIWPSSV